MPLLTVIEIFYIQHRRSTVYILLVSHNLQPAYIWVKAA